MPKHRLSAQSVEKIEPDADWIASHPKAKQCIFWDTATHAFGLVVGLNGSRTRTYVVQRRDRRVTIGRTTLISFRDAKDRAIQLLADLHAGKGTGRGPTLRAAMLEHVKSLRARGKSPRTLEDIQDVLPKYLSAWMERRIGDLLKSECRKRHEEITRDHGPVMANRVFRVLRAVVNTAIKQAEDDENFGNPAKSITWNEEQAKQNPIPVKELPAWRARIEDLGEVRRDFLLLVLLTGLGSEDAATVRFDDVEIGDTGAAIFRPTPKGGARKAFWIPLSMEALKILERRRDRNAIIFDQSVDLAFPCRNHSGKIVPLQERRWAPNKRPKGASNPDTGPHRLRRTFATICAQLGIAEMDIATLMNHRAPTGTMTRLYVNPETETLRPHVERVAEFLRGTMDLRADLTSSG